MNSTAPTDGSAFVRRAAPFVLAILGGLSYALHTRSAVLPWLAYLSTVPWLLLITMPGLRQRTWAFLLMIYVMLLGSSDWLYAFNAKSWLLAPLFYCPLFLLLLFQVRVVQSAWPRFPLLIVWPIAFTGTEWFVSHFSPGEISFFQLGLSQIEFSKLAQLADLTGVAGITFLVSAVAALIVELWRAPGARSIWFRAQAVGLCVLLAGAFAYGFCRDTASYFMPGPTVLIVQPAIPKWKEAALGQETFLRLVDRTRAALDRHRVDLVVWPENSVTDPIGTVKGGRISYGETVERSLGELARGSDVAILVDGPSRDTDRNLDFHTATLFSSSGEPVFCHKLLLVPWSEYIPLKGPFRIAGSASEQAYTGFVRKLVPFVEDMEIGSPKDLRAFRVSCKDGREFTFGTPVCFEITSVRVANHWHATRSEDRTGCDFLVNPGNDVLLGTSIREQTLIATRFRAIEGRVSVVRASNTGVSALVDPNGRIRETFGDSRSNRASGEFVTTVLVDLRRGTLYTKFRDWFSKACLFIGLILTGAALWRKMTAGLTSVRQTSATQPRL